MTARLHLPAPREVEIDVRAGCFRGGVVPVRLTDESRTYVTGSAISVGRI